MPAREANSSATIRPPLKSPFKSSSTTSPFRRKAKKRPGCGTFSDRYQARLAGVVDSDRPVDLRNQAYFTELLPLFGQIKNQADDILQLNQQNMSDANNRARRSAASARERMYVLLSVGTALAVVFVFFTRRWVLRPIHRLIRSADEIRRGNLDLVVAGDSRDEIGHLSEAFNAMAASLREFRRTDQAKLLRIQQATQQAFDSLPDAIAVIDPEGRVEVATESARTVFGLKPGFPSATFRSDGWPSSIARRGRRPRRVSRRPEVHPAIRRGRGALLPPGGGPDPGQPSG